MSTNLEERFETETIGEVQIIRLPAEMPAGFAEREPYRQALAKLIEASVKRKLILNLRNAPFYDSMSLGVLVSAERYLREHGYQCRFCGVSEQTMWGIQATQLTKVLAVFPNEAAALNGL